SGSGKILVTPAGPTGGVAVHARYHLRTSPQTRPAARGRNVPNPRHGPSRSSAANHRRQFYRPHGARSRPASSPLDNSSPLNSIARRVRDPLEASCLPCDNATLERPRVPRGPDLPARQCWHRSRVITHKEDRDVSYG